MDTLADLYQEVVFDHYRHPRNFGRLEHADHTAAGHNPLCGDQVTVFINTEGGVVTDIRFEGQGCAIATASASLMTEAVKGRPVSEVEALFKRFHTLLTDRASNEDDEELGKLAALAGVREFPVRVKCATLAWHTLEHALHDNPEPAVTE
ncbi:MAG: Fe-S cluster assembly sulfur transfer protein SufU [Betaproteobacteria bacterium]